MKSIGGPSGSGRRVVLAAVLSVFVAAGCANGHADPSVGDAPHDIVARHLELAAAGHVAEAMALLADDARWSLNGIELALDSELPSHASWVAEALGVSADASARDVVGGVLQTLSARAARPGLTGCTVAGAAVACRYAAPDALSDLTGAVERGTISATVEAGRIVSLVLETNEERGTPSPEYDTFRRWSAVRSMGREPTGTYIEMLRAQVADLEAWTEAGRPDIDGPRIGSDPVDVVLAWLAYRNGRDFPAMVGLMAGEALDSEVGSWSEFEAARLLERVVAARSCEVTAEGESLGAFVACDVEITDVIVAAAGTTSTNLNQSTFRVRDGRVIALPQYFPSSYVAEKAVETWAENVDPAAYAAACPDGIAGQSPVDGLPCARFIAGTVDGWGPIVAGLGLGD